MIRCLLAIDTSGGTAHAALRAPNGAVAARVHREALTHDEVVVQLARELCAEVQIRLTDLDEVVVGLGPGSFTGLRIGLSFAKGLVLGLNARLRGVLTLDAAIRDVALTFGRPIPAVAIRDAGRGELFVHWSGLREQTKDTERPVLVSTERFVHELDAVLRTNPDLIVATLESLTDLESVLREHGAAVHRCSNIGGGLISCADVHSFAGHESNHDDSFADESSVLQIAMLEPFYLRQVHAKTLQERAEEAKRREGLPRSSAKGP